MHSAECVAGFALWCPEARQRLAEARGRMLPCRAHTRIRSARECAPAAAHPDPRAGVSLSRALDGGEASDTCTCRQRSTQLTRTQWASRSPATVGPPRAPAELTA